ncbi:APC family permease [Phycisphaerales bacterium AB-hyl4]|uniref:APC family permease n=1 Tax=Natronomicrosphaera hydrolytica TaxID=3242702 RepID=A0ABV4UB69_9BACT
MTMSSSDQTLKRELGIFAAVMLGLGSIVGTGVFVSLGLGAGIAGPAVVLAIALAAALATCNGLSSAQLAAAHPVAGGTYEYGYKYMHPALGFTAGWMFLAAKSASAATAALGFAGYLLNAFAPEHGQLLVPLALLIAGLLTLLILTGIRRTSTANIVIVSLTLLSLIAFVVFGLPQLIERSDETLTPFFAGEADDRGLVPAILHATALMFVAYTGYGRIATMGEEIHNPRRSIPIAIIITLVVSAVLYMAVALVGVGAVGAQAFHDATREQAAPLVVIAQQIAGERSLLAMLILIGALTAMLGVLLNLILGLSRVALAMGRRGDLPGMFGLLNASGTPFAAIFLVTLIIMVLIRLGSVEATWSFSAFTVLIYYGLTNAAALRLPREQRLYPRVLAWAGLVGCVGLAFWVDLRYWLAGLVLIAVGLLWHAIARRLAFRESSNQA